MAKMIKCPTCGTQIEVPPQLTGQIVKCPGCGKGLKLVAKKPAGQAQAPMPGGGGINLSPGGSMAGGSSAGSIAAMTFTGEPPPDDMPNLDSNCAVCGRVTSPDELIEDNGRLVCPDCVKAARSRIDRAGPVDTFEFKGPAPAPVKRANIISITPAFIIGVLAALVLIACQVYLTLVAKPEGTLTASIDKRHGAAAATVAPDYNPETAPAPAPSATPPATAPSPGTEQGAAPAQPGNEPPTTVAINTQNPPQPPTVAPGPDQTTAAPPASNPSTG